MTASRAQQQVTAERRGKLVAMRLAGLSYEVIAERLEYSSRQAARVDFERTLAQTLDEERSTVDEYRKVENMRLDRIQAGIWAAAASGDLKAAETVLKFMLARWRLNGWESPIRAEVITIGYLDEEIARLTAELGENDTAPEDGETAQAAS